MAKKPYIDFEAALTLQESAYHVKHIPHPKGCTALLQKLKSIQYQLEETHQDSSLDNLNLSNYTIIHLAAKALQKSGYQQHNIDSLETSWVEKNTLYYDKYSTKDSIASKYTRFEQHCIIETCKLYNRGDQGGNTHSANMVSDPVATQMVSFEQRNDELEKIQ